MKKWVLSFALIACCVGCQEEPNSGVELCEWSEKCQTQAALNPGFNLENCKEIASDQYQKELDYLFVCEEEFKKYDECVAGIIQNASCDAVEAEIRKPDKCYKYAEDMAKCLDRGIMGNLMLTFLEETPVGGLLEDVMSIVGALLKSF